MIDHTLLRADATKEQFTTLCAQAREYGFAMVAINPYPVPQCAKELADSAVHVGAAIGFPLGQVTVADKVAETEQAIANGADEIDYVINITELKAGNDSYIEDEMSQIVTACSKAGVLSKVIFETCYLTEDEKRRLATIAAGVRPDFVKTSTGFHPAGGASTHAVALMRETVGDRLGVKASGGVRDWAAAQAMVDAGASRLGLSGTAAVLDGGTSEGY